MKPNQTKLSTLKKNFYTENIRHQYNCIITMISIITIVQIQAESVVSDTNGFINFWLQSLVTRGETQIIKAYANHTMLTPTPHTAHFVVF